MSETQNPFLDPEPPHWAARGLAFTIIALFVIAVIAAVLVPVPETVSGRFTLVPIRGTDPIRAQKEGVIAEVAVQEGDTVPLGATLFLIHSSPLSDRSSDLRTIETQLRANEERVRIVASQYSTRVRQDASERRRLETKARFLTALITSKQKRMTLTRELADSALSGTRTGSINRLDYTRLDLEATSLTEEVETARNDLDDAKAAIVRLAQDGEARDLEYREAKRGIEEAIETERIRITSMHQDVGTITDSGVVLQANCAGTILHLKVNGAGAVVAAGDILGELACRGDRLQGELELPESGVPLVRVGQGVKLRLDAFPYQRFGVRFGTVHWLGPTGESGPTPGSFRALIELAEDSIRVPGGHMQPLLPGMRGQADIVTGSRKLYLYAVEPMRALRENFREVPAK